MRTKTGLGIAGPVFGLLSMLQPSNASANTLARIMKGDQSLAHETRYNCPEDSCKVLDDIDLIKDFVDNKANQNNRSIDYMVAKECLEKCPNKPEIISRFFKDENKLIGSVKEEVEAAFIHGNQEAAHRLAANCNGPDGVEIRRKIWNLPDEVYMDPNMKDPQITVKNIVCSWSYAQEAQYNQTVHLGINNLPADKQEL